MPVCLTASDDELLDKFYRLATPDDVVDLLELSSYKFLAYYLYVLPEQKRYTKFVIPKKHRGERVILEPIPNLKIIQQKLLQVLQLVYEPKICVHGFTPERGIVSNARPHEGSRYVLNLDIKDFFPSITFARVRGMFMAYPYKLNDKVATILAQICCLRDCLPQGAPTSPIISNMLCAKLDSQLLQLARKNRAYYTRYADDLTFSTSVRHFPAALATIIPDRSGRRVKVGGELRRIIENNHFAINESKVHLQTRNKRQTVTGLTTNKFVNVNRKFIRQVRAMLHAWEKYGLDKAEQEYRDRYNKKPPDKPYKKNPSFRQVVKGKIEFIRMVRGESDRIYIRLNNEAAQIERSEGLTPLLFSILQNPDSEIETMIANGETADVEFKEGFCLNSHTNKRDQRMIDKVAEAAASMMNSQPVGNILIGVKDDGTILGIEREFATANPRKADWDGYALSLENVLKDQLSHDHIGQFYSLSPLRINGKLICHITTTKADMPVLAKNTLYVRQGTQDNKLSGQAMINFIRNWS